MLPIRVCVSVREAAVSSRWKIGRERKERVLAVTLICGFTRNDRDEIGRDWLCVSATRDQMPKMTGIYLPVCTKFNSSRKKTRKTKLTSFKTLTARTNRMCAPLSIEFSRHFTASIQLAFGRCHYHFDDDNNVCLQCNFNVIFMLIEICGTMPPLRPLNVTNQFRCL